MAHIHFVECNTAHTGNFAIDVPAGHHWLLVITKTPAQFWVNGGLKEYPAHSAVLYRPQQKVYYRSCTGHFVNDWIRFESDEAYITESPLPFGIPFALSDPQYCEKLIELLVVERSFNLDCKESSTDHLLRTLFNKLWESYFQDKITPQHYNLLKLRTAIQSNPGDYWTVSRMADFLRISPGYLQNIYKKTFGISCMDDVINSRIRMAKEYLIHNAQSIAEVASRCGYQNVEHFCRQFKQITGRTPGNFQKYAKN
ncbi:MULTISPECIES: AraC family transcriptional regulator [unclassified Paenibacillus]|uniref:helix-turn-helix transcriptional regulator n=1 Tax=unclassified Paenibacillus TaxID=185978 RepID=UPI002406A301|nr:MULTISPECIES: AraC family transcriptional regulator [unclassified Paenibacillus]MDF9842576.1 AraC-like DNA-binding protein [Paenibacillus sp. PastF-2]MDF9849217.1 AraC-like DNA-binding protein [Paenibacillus sp. PastM-2]MDF9855736.1 AraC-like DNA-binding protein [Paenibacillus sp. PastF-1]MDH6481059.1 AraC-like DNA-binding protein [Paenibacillus sp. PastH-2]MDH6508429.1 AraC-like DNA-binding protein [Paenibacillus sp. PastM-3]